MSANQKAKDTRQYRLFEQSDGPHYYRFFNTD